MPMELKNLADYISSGEAAKLLGVSTQTVQGWDRQKKLVARRHPINRFRLYLREDIMRLLEELNAQTDRPHADIAPAPKRRRPRGRRRGS